MQVQVGVLAPFMDSPVIVLGALLLLVLLAMSIARARSVLDQMDSVLTPLDPDGDGSEQEDPEEERDQRSA